MVPLFIFDFVDHQCFHEYFIGKKRSFHSFKVEVALLRYIVFYCELGCDTSEPHVSYIMTKPCVISAIINNRR